MMKKPLRWLLALIINFCILPAAPAQQQWQWGKRGQFPVRDIAVDRNGNTYVLWPISEQANVDGHPIPGRGSTDIAVTSFRCNGSYRWTKVIGSTGPDAGLAIGADSLDGIYVLGNNGSSNSAVTYIDDDTSVAPSLKKIMLVKYDTAGNFKWLRMPEPDNLPVATNTGAFNLTVEQDGRAHIIALLAAGTYGGSYAATFNDNKNIYALRYDRNGAFTGGLHFDITRSSTGIAAYGLGLVYDPVMMRYYYGGSRMEPNQISFGTTAIAGANFLACFNSSGDVLWTQKSNNNAIPTSLVGDPATDQAGNVYVTGYSYNDFNGGAGDGFGSYNFNNSMGVYGFPVIVKFNASGLVQYASNASVNTDNSGKAVACAQGILGLACEYGGGNFAWGAYHLSPNNQYVNNFLARFQAATGAVAGLDTINSGAGVNEYASALTADGYGNFYMGGEFQGTLIVNGVTLVKEDGASDGYIAKFGQNNCGCNLPQTSFNAATSGLQASVSYSGSMPVDSVVWSFGDGYSVAGFTASHVYSNAGDYEVCAMAFNSCGAAGHCQGISVSQGNTIQKPAAFARVLLYPNPSNGTLTLEGLPEGTGYRLVNALGVVVQAGNLPPGKAVIDLERQAAGWYTLQLSDAKGSRAQWKIIRQ